MRDDTSLPQGWARATMQDVGSIVGGSTPSTKNPAFWNGGDIPWITPADLSGYDHKFISRGARNITRLGLERSGAMLLPAGAVLFSSRAPIGYVAIASNPVSTNQGFKSFVLAPGIEPDYIYYYLQFAKPLAIALASGTTFQEISGQKARVIPVVVAPVAEQPRIVEAIESYLTRLDDAVASLERVQANLKAYRASVLKAAVEGRLVATEASLARVEKRDYEPAEVLLARILKERRRRWEEAELARLNANGKAPKDDKWKTKYKEPVAPDTSTLPKLPAGWCWATTDQIFWFVTSGSRGWARYYSESGAAFIRIGNLDHDSISLDLSEIQHVSPPRGAEGTRTRVAPGDVLISITADVGMVGLVRDQLEEGYINQHISLARPVHDICIPYLAWFLAARDGGQKQLLALQRGATKVGLGLDDIRSVSVPMPPLSEQRSIVDEIERGFSVAADCEAAVWRNELRARRLRQAILKWAFEGKLVDQDPTDEPAEELLARIRAGRDAFSPAKKTVGRRVRGAA